MKRVFLCLSLMVWASVTTTFASPTEDNAVIRINQLGYTPDAIKVAVFGALETEILKAFSLHDAKTDNLVFSSKTPEAKGAYGPFKSSY